MLIVYCILSIFLSSEIIETYIYKINDTSHFTFAFFFPYILLIALVFILTLSILYVLKKIKGKNN